MARLFVFGITMASRHRLVLQIRDTFERALPAPIVWYSDREDARFRPRVVSRTTYDTVTWRCKEVYRDVHEHFPNYEWYLRTWDDTHLVPSNLLAVMRREVVHEDVTLMTVQARQQPLGQEGVEHRGGRPLDVRD